MTTDFEKCRNAQLLQHAQAGPSWEAFRDTECYTHMVFAAWNLNDQKIIEGIHALPQSQDTFVLWRGVTPGPLPAELLVELQTILLDRGYMCNMHTNTDAVGKTCITCTLVANQNEFRSLSVL